MKRAAFILISILLCASYSEAAIFTVDDIRYNTNADGATVYVISKLNGKYKGDVVIPASVTYSGTTYTVTSIGWYAFRYCEELTSVTIPNSVTYIGNEAFDHCNSLKSITIPESVTGIGERAFGECTAIKSVAIPEAVTSIEIDAFYGCTSLAAITVDENNLVYDSRENCNAIVEKATNTLVHACKSTIIPSSVTALREGVFRDCKYLASMEIPGSVTVVGENTFSGCTGLTSVTIPNSVVSIGASAFSGCTALASIAIGNSVATIGESAFKQCKTLASVVLPASLNSVGYRAFSGCEGLTSVTCMAKYPPVSDETTFEGISEYCVLYVPKDRVPFYTGAKGWAGKFRYIDELGDGPTEIPGDVNHDGVVNVADVTAVINIILGQSK